MVTTFHLVRHAEKQAPPNILCGRSAGISLSARGVRQAEAIARRLRDEPVRHVFSGPLERARHTAAILSDSKRLPVRVCDAFDELDFGVWTGRSFADLEKEQQWRDFNERRSVASVPEGETMLGVQARVVGALLRLATEYPDESIVIVSHAEPIRAALLFALGIPLDGWHRVDVSVASISVVRFSERQGFVVGQMNETLPQSLSTP